MRYEIGYGVGETKDHTPIPDSEVIAADAAIMKEACHLFGGCNLTKGAGGWINDRGELVLEPSRVLVINATATNDRHMHYLISFIKVKLQQEAIAVTRFPDAKFEIVTGVCNVKALQKWRVKFAGDKRSIGVYAESRQEAIDLAREYGGVGKVASARRVQGE
jgi:hypothetical protein